METSPTWIVLVIQGILTIITLYSTRRKTGAEATKTDAEASQMIGGSWKQLSDELQQQIGKQDRRMASLQETIDALRRHQAEQDAIIAELRQQIELRDMAITARDKIIAQRDDIIAQRDREIKERDLTISRLETRVSHLEENQSKIRRGQL